MIALVVVAALAGCVGIPTSGGVQAGPLIGTQVNPEFVVLPSGPQLGATKEQILADFMQAVRGPQNDYAIAREFLSTDLALKWKPDASALIRTTSAVTTPGVASDTLDYSVTSKAYVDETGRYIEQDAATQTLQFGFTKENGEWRISQAADGIVLSQSSFNVGFTEQALFYFDPSFNYLIPDVRWFPSRATVSLRIARALLAGPAAWLQQGVVSTAFPVATTLGSRTIQISAGTAIVDLSKEALAASPQDRDRMRQQFLATLAPTLGVSTVVMTVGGIALPTPDQAGTAAVVNPSVESAVLVGTPTAFGFAADSGITPIDRVSAVVTGVGATTATLSSDHRYAAFLSSGGAAFVAGAATSGPGRTLDARAGLTAPTIDPFLYLWSAQSASAASLTSFDFEGNEHPVQSGLSPDARIISMALSRDGTRMLLYLSTANGPELRIAGIIRGTANAPVRLGDPLTLSVPSGKPISAAWVDDRTVASVSTGADGADVTVFQVGGPSTLLGQVPDAVALTGGNGGTDGLRVLRASGEIWRPQGSAGWVATGLSASFLGTKQ
jgi:hypothetical protein